MRQMDLRALALITLVSAAFGAGCGSSHTATLSASAVSAKVLPAPIGYQVDPTTGASGQVTQSVFDQFSGLTASDRLGYRAGFKQNYVDYDTEEGISVTVLEFASANEAQNYLKQTADKTLSFAGAKYQTFTEVPDATEAIGTKIYAGEYDHGVVAATGKFYYQLVYADASGSDVPVEFYTWVKDQWALLQPGVDLPTTPSTTS